MQARIVTFPGDGVGPEVVAQAVRVLEAVAERHGHTFTFDERKIGGIAIDTHGTPLRDEDVEAARDADGILLGAVGGPKWDNPNAAIRPEQGLLKIRKALRLFANRNVLAAIVVIFVFMGTVGTQYYLFTTYLQTVLGCTPLQAGVAFLPLSLCSMTASAKVVPFVLDRFGIRTALITGMLGVAASMVALALGMSATGTYWAVLPGVVLWGLFAGLSFPPIFVAVSTGVAPQQQGVVSALASTSQYIGSAVGLAALVAVATAGADPGAGAAGLVDGLQLAGWTAAAVTALGAVLGALVLRKPAPAPEPAAEVTKS